MISIDFVVISRVPKIFWWVFSPRFLKCIPHRTSFERKYRAGKFQIPSQGKPVANLRTLSFPHLRYTFKHADIGGTLAASVPLDR